MAWFRRNGLYIVVASYIVFVLIVLAWRLRWGFSDKGFSNEAANVAVTGFAAIGTLMAVAVALKTARDASTRAEKAEKDARQREDVLRRAAAEDAAQIRRDGIAREDHLRHEAEEREDRLRHDAVRPAISARATWNGDTLIVSYSNEGRDSALRFIAGYEYTASGIESGFTWCANPSGKVLRPLLAYREIELNLWERDLAALSGALDAGTKRLQDLYKVEAFAKTSFRRRLLDWLFALIPRLYDSLVKEQRINQVPDGFIERFIAQRMKVAESQAQQANDQYKELDDLVARMDQEIDRRRETVKKQELLHKEYSERDDELSGSLYFIAKNTPKGTAVRCLCRYRDILGWNWTCETRFALGVAIPDILTVPRMEAGLKGTPEAWTWLDNSEPKHDDSLLV